MRVEEVIRADVQTTEKNIVALLDAAKDRVWMSSSLYPEFYNREKVRQAVERAANTVAEFRLLLDADADWEKKQVELPWLPVLVKRGRVTVKASIEPIPHWLAVDERNFRLEKPHERGEVGINNLIVWDAIEPVGELLMEYFRDWWDDASLIG